MYNLGRMDSTLLPVLLEAVPGASTYGDIRVGTTSHDSEVVLMTPKETADTLSKSRERLELNS